MNTVIKTDLGRVRQHNEDAVMIVYNQDEIPLFVLADGMGGFQLKRRKHGWYLPLRN